ncbi:MAG TPA: DUF305 domain-containing protein [Sphingomicrobium sp.]
MAGAPHDQHNTGASWGKLAAMVGLSTVLMFVFMYQLVYEADHLFFSLNRFLASLLMACVMTLVMLGFMWPMYKGTTAKIAVVVVAALAGAALLATNRGQLLVGDTEFMEAMIPHHSIAINNARKADIRDPRVRRLADKIIEAQVREIEEMKILIADIDRNGKRGDTRLPPIAAQVTPEMRPEIARAVR